MWNRQQVVERNWGLAWGTEVREGIPEEAREESIQHGLHHREAGPDDAGVGFDNRPVGGLERGERDVHLAVGRIERNAAEDRGEADAWGRGQLASMYERVLLAPKKGSGTYNPPQLSTHIKLNLSFQDSAKLMTVAAGIPRITKSVTMLKAALQYQNAV